MKKNIYYKILLLTFFQLLSCKSDINSKKLASKNNLTPSQEFEFENWLKKHSLNQQMFDLMKLDTTFKVSKSKKVMLKRDSLELREYSTDSSYRLISNYVKNTKFDYDTEGPEYYYFKFLQKKQKGFFFGTLTLNKYPKNKDKFELLDYKWLNSNTFVFLKKVSKKEKETYFLTKLQVGNDTIWRYKTK